MLEKFISYLSTNCGVQKTDRILLACSGGVDSMILAALLKKIDQPFALAHCNFQLRDNESDLDEKLVRDWANENKIQLFVKTFPTRLIKKEQGGSTQMLARKLRYDWFNELLAENNFAYIATAHHLEDSIETFFINLSRGTGLSGLTGISANQNKLIRPLLFTDKKSILYYAKLNNIVWREDKSNSGDDYLRNRIRHEITPFFLQENQNWNKSMFQTLEYLSEAEQSLQHYFELLKKNIENVPGEFDIPALKQIKPLRLFLHHCFQKYGFADWQYRVVEESMGATESKMFLGNNCQLVLTRDKLILQNELKQELNLSFDKPGDLKNLPEIVEIEVLEATSEIISSIKSAGSQFTFMDLDLLNFPLKATHWLEGDRFTPLGMKGSRLVSDFFTDLKLDKIQKERQIILRSSKNDIIWIAGKRLDDGYKVSNQTRLILKIELADKS